MDRYARATRVRNGVAFSNMLQRGDDDLVERYTRAREIQADRMAEEIGEFGYDANRPPGLSVG